MVLESALLQAGNYVPHSFLLMSSFLVISVACSCRSVSNCEEKWGRLKLMWNALKAVSEEGIIKVKFLFFRSTGIKWLGRPGMQKCSDWRKKPRNPYGIHANMVPFAYFTHKTHNHIWCHRICCFWRGWNFSYSLKDTPFQALCRNTSAQPESLP